MELGYWGGCHTAFMDDTADLLEARARPLQLHRKGSLRQTMACGIHSGQMVRQRFTRRDTLSDTVRNGRIDVNGRRVEDNIFDCSPDRVGSYIFERLPSIAAQFQFQH